MIVGGAIWGNCNWGGSDIDIDVNRYNNFNRNDINNRNTNISNNHGNNNSNKWQHNPEHRKGVEYRDTATQQKYGQGGNQQGMQSREEFRGRAEQGRKQISREGAGNQRDLSGNQIGTRDTQRAPRRTAIWAAAQNRDVGGASRMRRIAEP